MCAINLFEKDGRAEMVGGAGAGGGAAAPPDGRVAAGSSRLDSKAINGTASQHVEDALLILPCRCRSWLCASCGPGFWSQIGARIKPHLHLFKQPRLLTLTLDRKNFVDAQDAFEYARPKIRTLLRLLGFEKAFSVMAFHPKAPDWPHWHILVDVADCGGRVGLERAWHLWRDEWRCGGLDLGEHKEGQTAEQAARYILGYCQHQAGVVGDWVLDLKRAPRTFECYGELRKAIQKSVIKEVLDTEPDALAVADDEACDEDYEDSTQPDPLTTRTVRDRLTECGRGSVVILRRTFGNDVSHRFVGKLSIRPGRLALADECGELHALTIRRQTRTLINGRQVLDVSVPLGKQNIKDVVRLLEQESRMLAESDRARSPITSPAFDEPYWSGEELPCPIPDDSADGEAPF